MGLFSLILNTVFPNKCFCCGISKTEAPYTLCYECWGKIVFETTVRCYRCKQPNYFYDIECGCDVKRYYCAGKSAILYNEIAKKLIGLFKYHKHFSLKYLFIKWLSIMAGDLVASCDIVVPVPLHKTKMYKRGYNQSFLLSALIAKKFGKPCLDVLVKKVDTISQNKLSEIERMSNVRNTFGMGAGYNRYVKGKKILIVDDVITTGSTLNECSKALIKGGAQSVSIATVATT